MIGNEKKIVGPFGFKKFSKAKRTYENVSPCGISKAIYLA